MTLTNPLKFEVKSDNVVLELSTAAFELVRGALVTRFNEDPELESSTSREAYYCDTVASKVDLNHTVESEVMKVFSGKTRCAKGATMYSLSISIELPIRFS